MPSQKDAILGKLAVERGYLTQECLDEALGIQRKMHDEMGMDQPLEQVLVAKHWLTADQAHELRNASAIETGEARLVAGYEAISKLGQGGMGAVYKARRVGTEELVALKVLPPSLADEQMIARFRRESEIVRRLDHENIVACVEFGFDRRRKVHFCALELVQGEDLAKRITRVGRLTEDEALSIAGQIAMALQHAFFNGLVHRDVKPENIMVTADGTAKLLDLGLARPASAEATRMTQSGMFVGSPYYASPEQALGEREVDARSDIYSLGATLYHMVTGKPPFEGTTALSILQKHVHEKLPWPAEMNPELSDGLCRIIAKMMEKSPDDRYQTPNDLNGDLDLLTEGEEPEVNDAALKNSSIRAPAVRPKRRGRPASHARIARERERKHRGPAERRRRDSAREHRRRAGREARCKPSGWSALPTGAKIGIPVVGALAAVGLGLLLTGGGKPVRPKPEHEPPDHRREDTTKVSLRESSEGQVPQHKAEPPAMAAGTDRETVFRPPTEWIGAEKESTKGNPFLVDGKPVWRLDRLWPDNPWKPANYVPLPYAGKRWDGHAWWTSAHQQGGQPSVSFNKGKMAFSTRSRWTVKHNWNKTPALVFIANADGLYGVEFKAFAYIFEGAESIKLWLIKLNRRRERVTGVHYLVIPKGETRQVKGFNVRLDAGEELAFVPRFRACHQAGNCIFTDLAIVRRAARDPGAVTGPSPPPDAASFAGHRYKLYEEATSWREAKHFCEAHGGHLVTITSKRENDFVTGLARRAGRDVWIGCTDDGHEGRWTWVTGEPFGFSGWQERQPDNSEGVEHWGTFRHGGDYSWNDARPAWRPFICEWEPSAARQPPAAMAADLILDLGGGVKMAFVYIKPGVFMMGGDVDVAPNHRWQGIEKPKHEVAITQGFYIGKYEVTQAQYEVVTGGNPSKWKEPSRPVEQVTWHQTTEFCRLATESTRRRFRLPTEAEWEYACRAGSAGRYCFGSDEGELGDYAWYGSNSGGQTHPVGQKKSNAWGLHDVHGNVGEWVADRYDAGYYAESPSENPTGPDAGARRLVRGAGYPGYAHKCRSAARYPFPPLKRSHLHGFRVAVSASAQGR